MAVPTSLNTPCIEWEGQRLKDGYGVIRAGVNRGRRAHVVSWEMENGPVPDGLNVLHRCDNPPCYQVDHLFVGTQAENVADMIAKGRHHNQQKSACPKCGGDYSLDSKGKRFCRPCHNARTAARKREKYWADAEAERDRSRAHSAASRARKKIA